MNRNFQQEQENFLEKDRTRKMRRELNKKLSKSSNNIKNKITEMRIRELMEEGY